MHRNQKACSRSGWNLDTLTDNLISSLYMGETCDRQV